MIKELSWILKELGLKLSWEDIFDIDWEVARRDYGDRAVKIVRNYGALVGKEFDFNRESLLQEAQRSRHTDIEFHEQLDY